MARDDHDLFRMVRSPQFANDVVAGFVWQFLRCQCEVYTDRSLGGEMSNHIGVFGADRCGGNLSGIAISGVRQAIVCAADRTDKRRRRSEVGGSFRPGLAVSDSFAVGSKA